VSGWSAFFRAVITLPVTNNLLHLRNAGQYSRPLSALRPE
jgi:hypothetical protein